MKTMFICQLPGEIQAEIETAIVSSLKAEGFKCVELEEITHNAMSGRLCDLEECIDVGKILPCYGCKYFEACGDLERTEPCDGKEV